MQNNFNINANFDKYIQSFLDENKKLNLISKNDEKFLYEKHIFDSLAVKLFFQKYGEIQNILDIGCGGGFPCVPVAIEFPHLQITGIDSIQKKINAVNNIKNTLHLDNLNMICGRIENFSSLKYDLILSRAVANIGKIISYGFPVLNKNGFLVVYKSQKVFQEIEDAKDILKQFNANIIDIIDYTLPLDEVYNRKLVVIQHAG